MFSIILYTNKPHENIDHNLKILKDTISSEDEIILLNYNRYHLEYRSDKDIEYHHINMVVNNAIDIALGRYCKNDDVIIIAPYIKISSNFIPKVKSIYQPLHMATCKTNTILNSEGNAEQDKRIGSSLRSTDFDLSLLIFNKKNTGSINGNHTKFISNVSQKGLRYQLYTNTTVYNISRIKRSSDALTIIYPSNSALFTKYVNSIKKKDDQVYTFPLNRRSSSYYMNKYILGTNTKKIVFVNPRSNVLTKDILNEIRTSKSNILYDVSSEITNDAILAFDKSDYRSSNKNHKVCSDIQKDIISYLKPEFKSAREKQKDIKYTENENVYSIIIPFMYNGDRFEIFEACIECLYKHLKDYDNVEIVIHETAPTRYLTNDFIEKYKLKYIFSKWDTLFHRAWSLNVVAKYIAQGNIFVFFDADLLINKTWVKELLNSDPDKVYIGWGKMNNLSNTSTQHYLNTGLLIKDYERIRYPSSHAAGGGINIIPRKIFMDIGGWPEENDKGYGGEDNYLNFLLNALNYIEKDY